MGGYIRLDKDLLEDPHVLDLADALLPSFAIIANDSLEFGRTDLKALLVSAIVGGLVRLWTYADIYIRADNSLPLSLTALAPKMGLPEWTLTKFPPKWLTVRAEDGRVVLPNYVEKNRLTPRDERRETSQEQRDKWSAQKRGQRARGHRADTKRTSTRTHRDRGADMSTGPHPVHPPTGTGTSTGRPIPVGEGGQSSEAVTASLASANGTSRCGPITAQTRSTQTLGTAALARAAIAKLKPPPPSKSDDEKRRDAVRLAGEFPTYTHADLARLTSLTVEDVAAILSAQPQPETIDEHKQT